ncbi:MAG: DMT family transporter [Desulfovibrionales bacterium]
MRTSVLKSNALLFLAAAIWGSTFVAQRMGMDTIGPFTYTGVRFTIGTVSLLPLLLIQGRRKKALPMEMELRGKSAFWGICAAGTALFAGINLQQIGLLTTTAGNAGFITGLYMVFVPFLGFFVGLRPGRGDLVGAAIALSGLYFLSIAAGFRITPGDLFVLAGAVGWAVHVLVLARLSPRMNSIHLAMGQFAFCAIMSLLIALFFENPTIEGILHESMPLLYGGIMSVGVAFTIQVFAQRHSPPTHTAVIMSLEAVFAALSGWLILNEILTGRQVLGAMLMLTGMLVIQLYPVRKSK